MEVVDWLPETKTYANILMSDSGIERYTKHYNTKILLCIELLRGPSKVLNIYLAHWTDLVSDSLQSNILLWRGSYTFLMPNPDAQIRDMHIIAIGTVTKNFSTCDQKIVFACDQNGQWLSPKRAVPCNTKSETVMFNGHMSWVGLNITWWYLLKDEKFIMSAHWMRNGTQDCRHHVFHAFQQPSLGHITKKPRNG